jgi:hypothetical protein
VDEGDGILARKYWRTWLGWGFLCFVLTGLGFALDAWLAPRPRWVLLGSHEPGQVFPDGRILTTGTRLGAYNGICTSLKTWDTFSRKERSEFFCNLVGYVTSGSIGGREFPDPGAQGFSMDQVVYSEDRRFCALLHRGGLALADLQSGREWPMAVKSRIVHHLDPGTAAIYQLLQCPIETKGLHEKLKLKNALEYISDATGGKLLFILDREAFAAEPRRDRPDPYEEEVCVPCVPSRMILNTVLHFVLSQVGAGNAGCLMRPGFLEITTAQRVREQEAWPPVFSPRGTFVVFMEGRPKGNTLHLVQCASGELLQSLPVHSDAYGVFDFTQDEDLLYYFASEKGKPLFTVWNTRTRQIVRTIPDINLVAGYLLAPDGKSLLVNSDAFDAGGVDLYDLRTAQNTRCFDVRSPSKITEKKELRHFLFSPDNRTLVKVTAGELQLWDVPQGKSRGRIKLGKLQGRWPPLFISADSRLLCALPDDLHSSTAWSLETGDRLWPPVEPVPENDDPLPRREILAEVYFGQADEYARFTPDRRFLVYRKKDRIDIVDPANGTASASLSLGQDAEPHRSITFTPNGRAMVTRWSFDQNRAPGLAEQWFGDWWPFLPNTACIVVADIGTGRVLLRVNEPGERLQRAAISDDGRTLILSRIANDADNVLAIYCWDVPGLPPHTLVFGIPLAFAGAAVLIRCWLGRTKKKLRPKSEVG